MPCYIRKDWEGLPTTGETIRIGGGGQGTGGQGREGGGREGRAQEGRGRGEREGVRGGGIGTDYPPQVTISRVGHRRAGAGREAWREGGQGRAGQRKLG